MNMKTSDEVMDFIYDVDLIYTPGEKIVYSDIGFILMGKIVEELSGKSLDVFAKENIFEPLEMYNTGYNPKNKELCAPTEHRNDNLYKGMVKGFVHDETALLLGGVAGHAGLFSTVKDVTHFIQMILNDGIFEGKRILSKITIDELYKVQVKEYSGVEVLPKARCLGWQTKDPASSAGDLISENTILHTGFTGTNVFIDRDNQIGFVLLTNRVHPTRNNTKHLHDRACFANYIMSHLEEWK